MTVLPKVTSLQIANSRIQKVTTELMKKVQTNVHEENRNTPDTTSVGTQTPDILGDLENKIDVNTNVLQNEVLEFSEFDVPLKSSFYCHSFHRMPLKNLEPWD